MLSAFRRVPLIQARSEGILKSTFFLDVVQGFTECQVWRGLVQVLPLFIRWLEQWWLEFKRSAMVALSRSKLASLSTFLGRRQRFLPTINLNLSLFSVHGLRKWQEMIFMYFRLELITAVLGPQAPWQSSLQTLKGCTCKVCKFGYYFFFKVNCCNGLICTCVFAADPYRLPCILDTSEPWMGFKDEGILFWKFWIYLVFPYFGLHWEHITWLSWQLKIGTIAVSRQIWKAFWTMRLKSSLYL